MKTNTPTSQNNWRKNPMVWMLIFFPALAVVAGTATIFIAIETEDGLVVDDYYKKGLQINQVIKRDQAAVAKNIAVDFSLNTQSGEIAIELTSMLGYPPPQSLKILLTHRTRSGLDQSTQLNQTQNNDYRGYVRPPVIGGRWAIEVSSDDWRLKKSFVSELKQPVSLKIRPE